MVIDAIHLKKIKLAVDCVFRVWVCARDVSVVGCECICMGLCLCFSAKAHEGPYKSVR